MPSEMVIALDIGGSSVKSGIVSSDHILLNEPLITVIEPSDTAEKLLNVFSSVIHEHVPMVRREEILGICLAFPGPFDYEKGICYIKGQAKYADLYGIDIGACLSADPGLSAIPVRFTGDAEAAVLGEARYGTGKPFNRIIGITLGTGFGSAFVENGTVVTSGEYIPENGWLYTVPFRGKIADEIFSSRGILAALAHAGVAAEDVKCAAETARNGDREAQDVFSAFGHDLGTFLTPFVESFQPDVVMLLGGITGAIDLFWKPLEHLLPVPVITSNLGIAAPLLGAADILFQQRQQNG
jgi:glucokinase